MVNKEDDSSGLRVPYVSLPMDSPSSSDIGVSPEMVAWLNTLAQPQMLANGMNISSLLDQMALPNFLAAPQLAPPPPNREAYCELCDKNFCNRYFLRTHKMKKHGIVEEGSPVKGTAASPIKDVKESQPEENDPSRLDRLLGNQEPISVKEEKKEFICDECDLHLDSQSQLDEHRALVHPDIRQFLNGFLSQQSAFGQLPFMMPPGLPVSSPFPLERDAPMALTPSSKLNNPLKRQYTSNGKNYCDLCNKEVCNKYFLRTHMLKMHGIVIDENKPVIGNIDTREKERTGELSFRCDMCSIVMKSRALLREHKQEAHGMPLPARKAPTDTPRAPEEEIGEDDEMRREGPSRKDEDVFKCDMCSYRSKHAQNMEYHRERHDRLNNEKKGDERDEEEDKEGDNEDKDDPLMAITQVALTMAASHQRVKCPRCHRSYTGQEALTRHFAMFHKTVIPGNFKTGLIRKLKKRHNPLLNGKKKEKRVWKMDGNSHTSGSLSPSDSVQSFMVHTDAPFLPPQFRLSLPVNSPLQSPVIIALHLTPV